MNEGKTTNETSDNSCPQTNEGPSTYRPINRAISSRMPGNTNYIETLSAELFARIAENIQRNGSPLAPLAATSKQCQTHVERLTFRTIKSSSSYLAELDRIMTDERFLAMRTLHYDISTLLNDIETSKEHYGHVIRISQEDAAAHNEYFANGLKSLLVWLSSKNKSAGIHRGMRLEIVGDHVESESYLVSELKEPERLLERNLHRTWVGLSEHSLPKELVVPAITDFYCNNMKYHTAAVWAATWPTLLAHFPNVVSANFVSYDNERKDLNGRCAARNAFGTSLRLLPPKLKRFEVEYASPPPFNHHLEPPYLADDDLGYDIFSHELGFLASRLETLEVHWMTLNLTQFFKATKHWPHLKSLTFVNQGSASADGQWYFQLDSRFDRDEFMEEFGGEDEETLEDMLENVKSGCITESDLPAAMDIPGLPFRGMMDYQKFNEIYSSMAVAVQRMPMLEHLTLQFELGGTGYQFGEGEHEFTFYRGDCYRSRHIPLMGDIQAIWGTNPRIEHIDESVVRAWRTVGKAADMRITLSIGDGEECKNIRTIE